MSHPHTTSVDAAADVVFAHRDAYGHSVIRDIQERSAPLTALLPPDITAVAVQIGRIVTFILRQAASAPENTGEMVLPPRLERFLTHLALDGQSVHLRDTHYPVLRDSVIAAFDQLINESDTIPAGDDTDDIRAAFVDTMTAATDLLVLTARGAQRVVAADRAEHGSNALSPVATATVLEVERRCRTTAVIRLKAKSRLHYYAGQYFPVLAPQAGGRRRYLWPAIPANDDGYVEFHVREVPTGAVSGDLVRLTRPGDEWEFGLPYGTLDVPTDDEGHIQQRDLVMIAHDCGLAPLRALILDMALTGGHPERVHLFYWAQSPGELYDSSALWNIAALEPWLILHPVVRQRQDDWQVGVSPAECASRALGVEEAPSAVHAALGYSTWSEHNFLIAGSAPMVRETIDALTDTGIAPERIYTD